jgi:hypothetical protein
MGVLEEGMMEDVELAVSEGLLHLFQSTQTS